jgi:hypothetical protein
MVVNLNVFDAASKVGRVKRCLRAVARIRLPHSVAMGLAWQLKTQAGYWLSSAMGTQSSSALHAMLDLCNNEIENG